MCVHNFALIPFVSNRLLPIGRTLSKRIVYQLAKRIRTT